MNDPLQSNRGDRNRNNEVVIDGRSGRAVPVRAYSKPGPAENEQDDLATVVHYFRILWKHKWFLLVAMTLGAIASSVYVLKLVPMYVAQTTVEIQKPLEPLGKPLMAQSSTETQIQLLLSSASRRQARKKLLEEKIEIQDTKIQGTLADVRHLLKLPDPAKTTEWGEAVGLASSFLTVTPMKDSDIVIIKTFSPNPQAAMEFVNTVAKEFKLAIQQERVESYQNTGEVLNFAQRKLKDNLEASQKELAEFAKTHGLGYSSSKGTGGGSVAEEKLKNIQTSYLDAQGDLIRKKSVTESIASSPTESNPAVLDSGQYASYIAQLSKLKTDRAALLLTRTTVNPEVKAIQAQIDELEALSLKERTRILDRSKIELDAAEKRVNKLEKEFELASKDFFNQSGDSITYSILQSAVESNRSLYDSALADAQQSSIASAFRGSGARVVDPASISTSPAQPDLMGYLTLGMLGGLVCGAGLVVLRSRADLTIQAPGVLEAEFNIRELGVIPSARTDHTARKLKKFSPALLTSGANGTPRKLDTVDCLEMVTRSEKPSIMAEAFRSTMTSILYSDENGDRPKVLVFTSSSSGEGKSTVISNLAIALAQIHQRVLLIDADMRLPRAHEIFDVPNSYGLSDLLHEQKPVDEYVEETLVKKTHIPYLYILPAGPARPHLSRLFHSVRMQDLMLRFRDTFDVVLIDSAPVLIVPDSRILARSADAVVLVVRAHQTQQEAAFTAAGRFASDGTRILGTILNDWNPDKSTQGYGGYYGYGNSGYYARTRE